MTAVYFVASINASDAIDADLVMSSISSDVFITLTS